MSFSVAETTDREALAAHFNRFAAAHAYGLANLDGPLWPSVRAFVARDERGIRAAAQLLAPDTLGPPLLYAVGAKGDAAIIALLDAIREALPSPCIATLAHGAADALGWDFAPAFTFLKMRLTTLAAADEQGPWRVERLGDPDFDELQRFYDTAAYGPDEGGFFRRYMLTLGPYVGVRVDGELIAAGGVHVCSERYGVAALGNIATAPAWRGRGLAGAITAALCRTLAPRVPLIALNVRKDNAPALACYRRIGFERVLDYEEGVIRATAPSRSAQASAGSD